MGTGDLNTLIGNEGADRSRTVEVFSSLDRLRELGSNINLTTTIMAVCHQGNISATIDLTPREMGPNTLLVLRGGHSLSSIRHSDDFKGFFIVVDNDRIDDMLPSLPYMMPCAIYFRDNPIIEITPIDVRRLLTIHRLISETQDNLHVLPYKGMTIKALCEVMFYEVLGLYTSRMSRRAHHPTRREELMSKFIDLVEKHYMRERTVIFYAKALCLSPKHLSAVVKETSGRTAGDWIDSQVILKAKMMLRNTGCTIQEISAALNFSNQSFFGKYFKQKTGMSPRAFRSSTDL